MSVITIAYYPLGLGLQIGEPMSHSGYSSPTKVLVGIELKMWGVFPKIVEFNLETFTIQNT